VSAPLTWLQLRWPREVSAEQVAAAMRLLAVGAGTPTIIESVGTANGIVHRLGVPEGRAEHLGEQLRAILPGLATITVPEREPLKLNRSVEVRLSTAYRPLRSDGTKQSSRTLLTALGSLNADETLALQWVLGRERRPKPVSSQLQHVAGESWVKDFALLPLGKQRPADSDVRRAMRDKHAESGWRAAGRIGVSARSRARERQLIRQVLDALRSVEAPGVGFWLRSRDPGLLDGRPRTRRYPLRLNALELAVLAGWPVDGQDLRIDHQPSRLLPPSRTVPIRGRVIGEANYPGKERPLALSTRDSLRHLHVLGPTGVGKSTLLAGLIAQDIAAGRGVVVVDPKSDLIEEVLRQIPAEREADVVVISPADRYHPVGVNPLAHSGEQPELVSDSLLATFKGLYAAHWGPRTEDILSAALLTLARVPGSSLVALPLLLGDAGFRRRMIRGIDDPIVLEPFWATFDSQWSDGERAQAVAPVLNKVRPFLRPQLRTILGQAEPRFDLKQVFTERKIILVDLAKGAIGEEAAALLGSLIVGGLWRATLQRASIPSERRHTVFVVLDEFQDYLRLPLDLSEALAQARGLGVSFTLAHQYLAQLDGKMRSAVMANAQNRVAFRPATEDARQLAAPGSGLDPEDFLGLGAFEFYAQLLAGGTIQPWCSGRSLPPADPISDPATIRAASRHAYGRSRIEVEAAISILASGAKQSSRDASDLTPRRRGGTS
jgi:hypothetical protein